MAIASLVVRIAADIAEFEQNLASAERSLQKTGKSMETVGTQLTKGLTVPIVAIGGLAAKAAIDFEDSFAGVRKTVDATEAQFLELEGAFRNLAKTMPLSANEINKVAESAGQLGVQRENIVAFTESMIKLGTATNLTADEAATGMARFANALGQPQIDMEKLGSALVALGNAGASTEKDILALAGRMAGAGAQINLTAGEIFGMANALSSVGIDAEKGGSAISRLFNDLNKSVTQGGNDLKEFAKIAGLTSDQFSTLFKADAGSAITQFIEGLNEIKTSGGNLLPVLDQLGITELRYRDTVLLAANAGKQFAESVKLGNQAFSEGRALNAEYQERLKTTASQLIILKNNLMDVAITFGQAMLPAINSVVSGAKPLVAAFAGMAEGFKALPGPIRDSSLAFLALLAAAGPVVFIASQVVKAWASLLTVLRLVPLAIGAVSTAFIAVAGAMGATTTGLSGLRGALALTRLAVLAFASSFGAIPTALIAIIAALPKAKQGLDNLNEAVTKKGFWDLVTAKDAPAIWEKEFWGWSRGADAAANSFNKLGGASRIISEEFVPSIMAVRKNISGEDLADKVRDLASGFAQLSPELQRSSDVMRRTGEEALRLRDAGAQLSPELDKLANKAMKDIAREAAKATKEIDTQRKAVQELTDEWSGAKLAAEVKKAEEAFRGLTAEQLKSPDVQRRVGEAAEKLRLEGAKLTPELHAAAVAFRDLNAASDFGGQGFDQFENIHEWLPTFEKFVEDMDRLGKLSNFGEQGFDKFENTKDFETQLKPFTVIVTGKEVLQDLVGLINDVGDAIGGLPGEFLKASAKIVGSLTSVSQAWDKLVAQEKAGQRVSIAQLTQFTVAAAALVLTYVQTVKSILERDSLTAKMVRDFEELHGGFRRLMTEAQLAGVSLDRLYDTDSASEFRREADLVEAAIRAQNDAMERYDLTWRDFNQTIRQSQINQIVRDLAADFRNLVAAGADPTRVIQGMSGALNQFILDAINTGIQIPHAMRPMIEAMIRARLVTEDVARAMLGMAADTMPSLADITAAADRYGLKLDDLGPKVQQLRITETAQQIVKDFDLLILAGADVETVLRGMQLSVQGLVTRALTLGLALPESMRPLLEAMVRLGLLTDENGIKLEDLGRIKFEESLVGAIDRLIEALGFLIDEMNDVGSAADIMWTKVRGDNPVTGTAIPRGTPPPPPPTTPTPPPGAPSGTTPPPLPPGSRTPPSSTMTADPGSMTISFDLDGNQIATATVPYLPGAIRRYVPA